MGGVSQSMRRVLAALLCVGLLAPGGLSQVEAQQGTAAKDIAKRALPAVVTIETFDAQGRGLSQGSGFIATSNGLVVTNFHVIDGAASANVLLQSGDTYRVDGVLELDVAKDFAVLKIKAIDLPSLPMGNSERLEPGEAVIALGAPRGLSGSITMGIFSQLRGADGFRWIQHSASISPGSSGGPLLLENGQVVGINTWQRQDGASLFFALPVNYVRAAIQETDGQLMSLQSVEQGVTQARERLMRASAEKALDELFFAYRDPENLFTALLPRAWQVQRNAWTDKDGVYHVTVMSYAPDAQFAEINGWLSEGVRLNLSFPPTGRVWAQNSASGWIADGERGLAQSYARHELIDRRAVDVGGSRGNRVEVTGTMAKLREAEWSVVFYLFHEAGRVSIDLAAPESKAEDARVMAAIFERSLQFGWTKPR
jgi:hypothetical protein